METLYFNMTKIEGFLTHTETLINHIYWFKQDFKIKPAKEHLGTAINYNDVKERKSDFLKELVNTVCGWVYSQQKSKQIIDSRLVRTNDLSNAASFLTTQAFSKFRPGKPQGQFGELLLFNFIQHFFKAAPLLRKQKITTSVGHERFGADAIHYKSEDDHNVLILGESKCYESQYTFNSAFESALESICKTFNELDDELDLYTYDDFIEPELQQTAEQYKNGELSNIKFELVCMIAYNESNKVNGNSETEIKESIRNIINTRCSSIKQSCFNEVDDKLIERINYIIFPIWKLDEYLNEFQTLVGSK